MRARILAMGVTIAALVLGTTVWAAGAGDISSPQTLHLVSLVKQGTILDLGPSGPSLGDEQVASGALLHGGQQVGRFSFVCTWTGVHTHHANEHCVGSGEIAGGQITFDGLSRTDRSRHVWAVTGGTGTYRNARGQVLIKDVTNTKSRATIELI